MIPSRVPETLKSISPILSSSTEISDKITNLFFPFTRPIAMPDTTFLIGTPASINAKIDPQTVAFDVDPLDSSISVLRRIV